MIHISNARTMSKILATDIQGHLPHKLLQPLRIVGSLLSFTRPPLLDQRIATPSTGEVTTQVSRMVHFGESGQGPSPQEARRCHHTEHFGSNQTGQENPALGPKRLAEITWQNPHGNFVTERHALDFDGNGRGKWKGQKTYSK